MELMSSFASLVTLLYANVFYLHNIEVIALQISYQETHNHGQYFEPEKRTNDNRDNNKIMWKLEG